MSLSNSVLCQRWESEAGDEVLWQFVIPSNLRNDILHELPTMETAGHVGANKTLERVNKRFYWPGCTKDVKDWCKSLGMDKTNTLHPQSDVVVERFNWTIEGMLSKFVAENQYWDSHLPILMMAYCCAVHESTSFTPCELMFGHQIDLPIDLQLGQPKEESQW